MTAPQALDVGNIIDALVSHAMASGYFERVNGHEPKNSPGNGLTAAAWLDTIGPALATSGLSITSARLVFNLRIYSNMLADPQDGIDPAVGAAVDALFTAYNGDFELGGTARCIDILGQSGPPLSGKAGYISQDGKMFRCMTINIPVIRNDVWSQNP